jgi:CheY-like chemotaxis protein
MNQKVRILLVDDDVDFIEQNKIVLENRGFEVIACSSGREGLDKVRFEQPDLIVLDLMMEKHDTGFAVAKALKADPVFKRIPILMVSSAMEKSGTEFSQEMDGYWMKTDDYVSKPIQPEDLLKRINSLLARARAVA